MKALAPVFFFLVVALTLQAADAVPTIVADPLPPAKITGLYIEKDEKGSIIVIQLAGDSVTYKATQDGKVVDSATVQPAGDDWFAFIQALNNAKVYKWAPQYDYPAQGATWIIDLSMDTRKLTSAGTNDYPKEGDESQPAADPSGKPSVPFQIFWQAALTLVGKGTVANPTH